MRFKDKVALITAAANGIGRATATIMVREGATVIVVDNHQGRLDEAVPALRQAGGKSGGKVEGKLVDALDAAAGRQAGRRSRARPRPHRHPGQRGRRQHGDRQSAGHDRAADLRRLAEADRLQPRRHLPVHPRGDPGDEAAAQRQDRQPGLDRRARPQRQQLERLCRGQGRHHRLHPQARPRARARRHQRQCHRPQHHARPNASGRIGRSARRARRPRRSNARRCAASPKRSTRPT